MRKMYRIALCDNNKEYLEQLEDKIHRFCEDHNIDILLQSFDDSDMLVESIEDKKMYDAYILDIEMPRYSGMEIAKKIKEYLKTPFIVFLSAYKKYAIEACGLEIFRYIVKSQLDVQLSLVLDEMFVRLSQQQNNDVYIINNQRRYIKLPQSDIFYIYKKQKNAFFVMDNGEEWERITLQEVYEKLNPLYMVMIDRGLIINIQHIKRISENQIEIDGGYKVSTSQKHIVELKNLLNIYWGKII